MRPLLLVYPGNEALGDSLRRALDAEQVNFSMRRFPDRETYVRINSEVKRRSVAILCSLRDPDAHFLPLVFLAETLRDLGASKIGLIAPYLAYMRQDARFQPGEAITSLSFARLLSMQFEWLVTVDPHLHRHRALNELYALPATAVSAAPFITQWMRQNAPGAFIVGPDMESQQWVSAVAEAVPAPFVILNKTRTGDRKVAVKLPSNIEEWTDRTPVIVDDIISSARTMVETVRQLDAAGFKKPICLGVHGVFAEDAYDELSKAGARIVTTNSIAHPSNEIDLSGALLEPVKKFLC